MACVVCSKPTWWLGSVDCDKGHKVHKKCLDENKNGMKLKTCRYCVLVFIKRVEKPSAICVVCQEERNNSESKCKVYRNICVKCQPNLLVKQHYKECKVCRGINFEKIASCGNCDEPVSKDAVFFQPRCGSHRFCKPCLNAGGQTSLSCESCKFFFQFLARPIMPNEACCNLCGKFPEGEAFRCSQMHSYCKLCLKFLNLNVLDVFERVNRCEFCVEKLKKHLSGDHRENGSLKQPEEPISDPILPEDIEPAKVEPDEFKSVIDSENEPKIKEEDKTVLEEEKKIIKVEKKELKTNPFYQQKKACETCRINQGIGFHCGHFSCEICLVKSFMSELLYILALIDGGLFDRIPRRFEFNCIVNGCREKIQIPSQMIINKVFTQMEQRQIDMYYMLNSYFDGIPMRIERCQCSNIVLSSGFFRIFCTC